VLAFPIFLSAALIWPQRFEQSLGHHLVCEKINASRVAARPSEAGDKSEPDRVFADAERSVMFAVVKNSTMAARIPPRI